MKTDKQRIDDLRNAIFEANRFVEKARKALNRIKEDRFALICGSKETASAKRASLDLTRALVEMRKTDDS